MIGRRPNHPLPPGHCRRVPPAALFQELLVTAVEHAGTDVIEDNQPVGQGVQKHLVVGDHDHRAVEIVDGGQQGVAGVHVQMVGGFVQHQQVHRGDQQFAQHHPAFLTTGEHADLLQGAVALEHHGPADVAGLLAVHVRLGVEELLLHGAAVHQALDVGLLEHPGLDLRVVGDLARCRGQAAGQHLEQCGLALAVFTHDADPLPGQNGKAQVFEKRPLRPPGKGETFNGAHLLGLERLAAKGELQVFGLLQLVLFFHLGQGFNPGLDHVGQPGFGPEPGDEQADLLFAALVVEPGLFVDLLILGDAVVVLFRVAFDLSGLFAVNAHGVGHQLVHEPPVVGDQHQLMGPGEQKILDPADGGDVQVVGGLVQQQQVRFRDQHLGQVEPHLEAAGKIMGASDHVAVGEPQAGQDFLHLPVVIFFRCDQSFHALGQHGGFGKLDVLLNITDAIPFGHGDGAVVAAFLADDDAKQGRLAVAVAAHQAHPFF